MHYFYLFMKNKRFYNNIKLKFSDLFPHLFIFHFIFVLFNFGHGKIRTNHFDTIEYFIFNEIII